MGGHHSQQATENPPSLWIGETPIKSLRASIRVPLREVPIGGRMKINALRER